MLEINSPSDGLLRVPERVERPTDQLLRDGLTVLNRNLRMPDDEKPHRQEHTHQLVASAVHAV